MTIVLGTGAVVEGMEQGLRVLTLGAVARLHVPPHLGYGAEGVGIIPPSCELVFEVELLGISGKPYF